MSATLTDEERRQRWRLVLGSEADASCGTLNGAPAEMDQALSALYEADGPGGVTGEGPPWWPWRLGAERGALAG